MGHPFLSIVQKKKVKENLEGQTHCASSLWLPSRRHSSKHGAPSECNPGGRCLRAGGVVFGCRAGLCSRQHIGSLLVLASAGSFVWGLVGARVKACTLHGLPVVPSRCYSSSTAITYCARIAAPPHAAARSPAAPQHGSYLPHPRFLLGLGRHADTQAHAHATPSPRTPCARREHALGTVCTQTTSREGAQRRNYLVGRHQASAPCLLALGSLCHLGSAPAAVPVVDTDGAGRRSAGLSSHWKHPAAPSRVRVDHVRARRLSTQE